MAGQKFAPLAVANDASKPKITVHLIIAGLLPLELQQRPRPKLTENYNKCEGMTTAY